MFPYDNQLAAAVAAPVHSIDDVIRTMNAIQAICIDGDGLKWFNWLYLQVTNAVGARVQAGGFSDPAWLAQLDVQFAGLYFGALKTHLAGQPTPGCWRALFDRRNQAAIARIQFAVAGINAHINHDLPIAIVATSTLTNTVPSHSTKHYADYTGLNTTLGGLVDVAKRELHVRLLGDALPPMSHVEDTVAAFSVTAAREAAWNTAEILWALRNFPTLRDRTIANIDGLTTLAGKTILAPVPIATAVTT